MNCSDLRGRCIWVRAEADHKGDRPAFVIANDDTWAIIIVGFGNVHRLEMKVVVSERSRMSKLWTCSGRRGLTKDTAFYIDNIYKIDIEDIVEVCPTRIDPYNLARFEDLHHSALMIRVRS